MLLRELTKKLQRKSTDENSGSARTPGVGICSGNLLSICVLPDCEGTGVGGKLIESFQFACKTKGYERLTLSVVKQNSRAAAFYKKHGWRQSGITGESIRFILDL